MNQQDIAETLAAHRLFGEYGDEFCVCGCGWQTPPDAWEVHYGELVAHERHVAEVVARQFSEAS